jgi:pimeloyl-ACP methyl ester carboxylesterase
MDTAAVRPETPMPSYPRRRTDRPHPPPRRRATLTSTLQRLALVGGVALAARSAMHARRELAAWHLAEERLEHVRAQVPAVAGLGKLTINARVARPPRTSYPSVVLVHGLGMSSAYLAPLAARVGRHADVYAPDLPGHGWSDDDERPLSIPDLAHALASWLDAMQLRGVILVGHSMGTQVVTEVAVRRPELVSGLVLIAPTSDPAVRTPARLLRRSLRSMLAERPSFALWALADWLRTGPGRIAFEMRETLEHRLESKLPDVRAPVRVVRGERDHLVPQRWAEAVARSANAPKPAAIAGWGHAVQYDDPDAIVKTIFTLARSLRAAARPLPVAPMRVAGSTDDAQRAVR